MGLFLLLLSAVCLALALHPFTTYPLSLTLLARLRPRPVMGGRPDVPVALCVCAYNEAGVIRAKVQNMLALRDTVPSLELLVYVDAATDGTADILREYGDRIRLFVSPTRMGKTHGMNRLVQAAGAALVVFSDANVRFAADALPKLLAPFADPTIGCVCGHLIYETDAANATAATGSLYWRLEEYIKRQESATGSVMGADGSIFAIRRALHRPPPPDLIDDMYVSLAILCEGARIVRVADACAYEEAVSRPGEEFRRKQRIACQAFNVHRALRTRLRTLSWFDSYKYVSHKLLRWLVIYLLGAGLGLLAAGLAAQGAWTMLALLTMAAAVGAGALLLPLGGPVGAARDALVAFVATGIGIARSLRGDRFQTWEPPASARRLPMPGHTAAG